jgi:hypothetical protein
MLKRDGCFSGCLSCAFRTRYSDGGEQIPAGFRYSLSSTHHCVDHRCAARFEEFPRDLNISLERRKRSSGIRTPNGNDYGNDYGKDLLRQHDERQHSDARTL